MRNEVANQENEPKIPRKSYKDLILQLNRMLSGPDNPANRNQNVLRQGKPYALNYLAFHLGINEEDVHELLKRIPGFNYYSSDLPKNVERVYILFNAEKAKDFVSKEIKTFNEKKNQLPNLKPIPKEHPAVLESEESLKSGFSGKELKFLTVLFNTRGTKFFHASRLGPLAEPDIVRAFPKALRLELFKKAIELGLMETDEAGQIRFCEKPEKNIRKAFKA